MEGQFEGGVETLDSGEIEVVTAGAPGDKTVNVICDGEQRLSSQGVDDLIEVLRQAQSAL